MMVESLNKKENPVYQRNIPGLNPGSGYTNRVVYSVSTNKNYLFRATADYKNVVNESNENNNRNSVTFSVGKSF